MFYTLGSGLQTVGQSPAVPWRDMLIILTAEEFSALLSPEQLAGFKLPDMRHIRYCKADIEDGRLTGTIVRPHQTSQKQKAAFVFAMWQGNLLLIDEHSYCQHTAERLHQVTSKTPWTAGRVFCDLLEGLIKNDLEFLTSLEDKAARIEREILEDASFKNIDQQLIAFRKEVSAFSNYYLQLADMAEKLQEDTEDYFTDDEERRLKIFGERVSRLREEALMLREYAMQIREVYQAQIGIRQNEIMKLLTVVTSIFLPLSLIAGWYGMNFTYMPELHWPWAYPAVIGVSLAIAVGSMLFFKYKKFW